MLSVGRISRNRITALYQPIRSTRLPQKSMNCHKRPPQEEVTQVAQPLARAFAILDVTPHVQAAPALALAPAKHRALEAVKQPAMILAPEAVRATAKPLAQDLVLVPAQAPAPEPAKPTAPSLVQVAALAVVLGAEVNVSPAVKEAAETVTVHAEITAPAAPGAVNLDVVEIPAKEIAHSRVRVVAHFCDLKGPIVWIQLLFSALHRMLKTALPVAIRPSATF